MNQEIEQLLLDKGASMVGFAKIEDYYDDTAFHGLSDEALEEEVLNIPRYPYGISIILAHPQEVIRNIHSSPTMDYFNAYHRLNNKLNELAILCADYIKAQGYHAYPQTTTVTKHDNNYRTIMPHKTVAVNAGLGWVGKSALFISEQYGSAIRLTSVLTDAPIEYNKNIMQPKCGGCMLCTNACPGKAISGRLWSPELNRDDIYDAQACKKKARELAAKAINKEITLCGKCIEVCPYTKKYTYA